MKKILLTTLLTFAFLAMANLAIAQDGTEIFTESFDAAASTSGWNTGGDATTRPDDITIEWAETAGVNASGALRLSGLNSDASAGRAYIFEKVFSPVDFGGATDVTVTMDIKSEGLTSTNFAILTDINGSIQENPSATGNINESEFTTLTFDHSAISGGSNFLKILYNIATGAELNAGGSVLVDNITVIANEGSGGTGEELLTNGDFEDGRAPWTDTAGEIRTEGGNSFFFADVQAAGQPFDVNLSQAGIAFTEGDNYTLTFEASTGAGTTRTMIAGIGLNVDPFTSATETLELTDQTQTFEFVFTANFSSSDGRVLFDMGAATGVVVIDNVSLVQGGEVAPSAEPQVAAPTPPSRDAANVISLFSDAYTNVNVTTWSTDWSEGTTNTDIVVEGDNVKRFNLVNFSGIQLENSIDLSNFTHMHFDYWVADELTAGEVFNPKLSNHGNLPGTAGETNAIEFTNPVTTSQEWVTFDVPLDNFSLAGGSTTARDKIYQIILAANGTLDVVYIDNLYFYNQNATSNEDVNEVATEFTLKQNYPNPFNPSTSITYNLPSSGEVTLEVFNVTGQQVATLVNGVKSAGSHTATFDASNLSSGVYMYRLQSGNSVQIRKMLLIK